MKKTSSKIKHYSKTSLLIMVTSLWLMACSSTSKNGASSSYNSKKAQLIVYQAKKMLGIKYLYGGSSPSQGFDCSGLVLYTHSKVSNGIPRVSIEQYKMAQSITLEQIKPGDLLFYKTSASPSHVTIYIGNRQFIHAPSSGKRVKIGSMDNPYFKERLVKIGRLY